jgi:hypothetical protein
MSVIAVTATANNLPMISAPRCAQFQAVFN